MRSAVRRRFGCGRELAPGEPAWEEAAVRRGGGGFLCEFHFAASCRPLAVEPGATAAAGLVTLWHLSEPAARGAFRALPLGSTCGGAPRGWSWSARRRWERPRGAGAGKPQVPGPAASSAAAADTSARPVTGPRTACARRTPPCRRTGAPAGRRPSTRCHQLCEHFCHLHGLGNYTCICEAGYQLAGRPARVRTVDDCGARCPVRARRAASTLRAASSATASQTLTWWTAGVRGPVDPCFGNSCSTSASRWAGPNTSASAPRAWRLSRRPAQVPGCSATRLRARLTATPTIRPSAGALKATS